MCNRQMETTLLNDVSSHFFRRIVPMYSKISTIRQYTHVANSKETQKRISDVLEQVDSLKLKAHYSNYRFDDADRTVQEALQSIKTSQRVINAYDNILLDDEDIEKIHEDL